MSIQLSDNINYNAPKAADNRYGPYTDTATALSSVISANRYQGLVVGINDSGSIVEYWFRDGIADVNLIIKIDNTANAASANIATLFAIDNSQNTNISIIQGVDNTQNSWISSNAAFTQAAFNQANTTAGGLLTANDNISIIQGVNNTQNTQIQTVYNTANVGYNFVNTGGTVTGNVSINGNLNVTGNVTAIGNVINQVITGNTGQFFGNTISGFGALYAGIPTGYVLAPYAITQTVGNVQGGSAYTDIQNINANNASSSDVTATADNGSFTDTYVDMGITSSTYNQDAYNLYGPNDGYVIVSGNTTTGGGNLIFNTYTPKDIIFALGGTTTSNEIARFKYNTGLILTQFPITFSDGTTQNTAGSSVANTIYLQGAINSANANISYLFGVQTTQNSWISSNNAFTQLAFNQANSANTLANSAYNLAQSAYNYANTIPSGGGGGVSASGYNPNSVIFANTTGYLSNTSNIQFFTSNNNLFVANSIITGTLYTINQGIYFPDGSVQATAASPTNPFNLDLGFVTETIFVNQNLDMGTVF